MVHDIRENNARPHVILQTIKELAINQALLDISRTSQSAAPQLFADKSLRLAFQVYDLSIQTTQRLGIS